MARECNGIGSEMFTVVFDWNAGIATYHVRACAAKSGQFAYLGITLYFIKL